MSDKEGSRGFTPVTWPTAIMGILQKRIAIYRPEQLGSHTLKYTSTPARFYFNLSDADIEA
jgi:hypothetical protein